MLAIHYFEVFWVLSAIFERFQPIILPILFFMSQVINFVPLELGCVVILVILSTLVVLTVFTVRLEPYRTSEGSFIELGFR
jgi:hypothetical protein